MAKWFKDYLSFGSRRGPPQPPKPDYTESEILKAYRAQKDLDFEDPYENSENRSQNGTGVVDHFASFGTILSNGVEFKVVSPKHRLIKVDSQEFGRCKVPLSLVPFEESSPPVVPSAPTVGDTDYSDPFDARPDPRPRSRPHVQPSSVESCSYMEPFEAQRVITELQHGPERGWPREEPQLYDSPYEDRGGQRQAAPVEDERESRLPQDDERPADEYDQPWEWKKDNISKALAVQFESTDWDQHTLPHTDQGRVPRTSPTSSRSTSLRRPTDPHLMLGERVDPYLPLGKQVWYHGALTRSEAESLLTLCKECSYLVRNSQSSRTDFSLSIRSSHGFMHMKFSRSRDGKYILGENSPPFDTIPEVIHYYTTHKLPIRAAEHMSLLFPVVVQTL
ncbi:src homology 2 domain containing transforming protein D, a isoform X2 [Denticeps clupeoides]|uniref:SH2 domain-containing protein n=2 Tax=Denticeps clupeoides TaxID=299321 RepID=A0AAY4BN76_9TELE|nr:SH2 domain-containing adapter protein D isoform X2 [Denticeps clupeoides]XP_028831058.1 SH2 domain-containing adapter protein D isoform X2 [Denticeps clupeoides]XP_028831059.1 SH2 domain-containing adapter protein D isoform X2 [Denticeps clupeoides]XP_028831060.1 SH2 domain-containing adapter protein D isoform X2 [Denticeps clupeoides]